MLNQLYINEIASRLGVKPYQVENCVQMLEDGDTIPFISRYRKEKTGGLEDVEIVQINHLAGVFSDLEKRKATVKATIEGLGKLTPELKAAIDNCIQPVELEDLYLPYRPKRRTRASVAKENGLEPLADAIFSGKTWDAGKYLSDKVASEEEALAGARDIIAERVSENADVRNYVRSVFNKRRITSRASGKKASGPEAQKYKSYFNYSEPLSQIAPHRLLAILRGEAEGFLTVGIDADALRAAGYICDRLCPRDAMRSAGASQVRQAVEDSLSRLIFPSITTEVLGQAKEKADEASVRIFGNNLRQLLLAPPLGNKRILAIDPGYRNGCKMVCLGRAGELLDSAIIYPHPPQNEKIKSITTVSRLIDKYEIEAIAVGNGTASRETEDFIRRIPLPEGCGIYVVSEDGASVYSASDVAREEFPDEDVTVRGAVSIGRRLMDPLSELVKIDPKSLGVGQYQHDVDQKLLREELDSTVESCVNSVGVDLNTASPYLLRYVAGIGPSLAAAIVQRRSSQGAFSSREQLKEVPRLGEKAFRQCAGFLRIRGAENPLDGSAVHPESYHIVESMARDLGVPSSELVGNASLCAGIDPQRYVGGDAGLPTIKDILAELARPGRDPRGTAGEFSFAEDVHTLEDLHEGMELPGIVTNVTAFGAFVDIGVHQDGLIHVSKLGRRGEADPFKAVRLHQHIKVRVLSVDMERSRISLEKLS